MYEYAVFTIFKVVKKIKIVKMESNNFFKSVLRDSRVPKLKSATEYNCTKRPKKIL